MARTAAKTPARKAARKTSSRKTVPAVGEPPPGVADPDAEAADIGTETGDIGAEPFGRKLARLGCDPIAVIAAIANDANADPRLRLAAAKELAAYLMSKPRGAMAPATAVDVAAIIARGWSARPDAEAVP